MDRKKRKNSSGFYIAICCCVVIIAIVGYANRTSLRQNEKENNISQRAQMTQRPIVTQSPTKAPTQKTKATEKPIPANKNVQVEEKVQFNAPVKGKVIEEYSGDELVYNETLKDWRAHSGVDFEATMGEQIVCSANGVVEDVFNSSLGRCVIVDHKNGFKTMYANLNEDVMVKKGDEIAQGDTIGTVGDTALGDSTSVPHLHFEMTNNDKCVNPIDFLE